MLIKVVVPRQLKAQLGDLDFPEEFSTRPRIGEYIQASNGRCCRIRSIIHLHPKKGVAKVPQKLEDVEEQKPGKLIRINPKKEVMVKPKEYVMLVEVE